MEFWMNATIISLLCFALGSIFHHLFLNTKTRSVRLPPQPPALPVIGHMHLLSARHLHRSLQALSRKYGPLFHLRLGSVKMVVATSPDMSREFLKFHDREFASRPQTINSRYSTYNFQDIVMAPHGHHWQRLRKICSLELFSPRRLESFRSIREDEVSRMVRSVWEHTESEREVNIRTEMWSVTYNNICRMVMGKRSSSESLKRYKIHERIDENIRLAAEFHVGDYFPSLGWMDFRGIESRIKKVTNDLDAAMQEIVEEHRELRKQLKLDSPPKDMIDVLLTLSGDDDIKDGKLGDNTIKAVVIDLFGAGTETSSTTTEWAMAELLRSPRVMERMREELNSVVGCNRMVRESDLGQLIYLEAVVKETLRLHPPAPLLVPHENPEACEVGGYTIPAKTWLLVNVWAIGRDPMVWENPLEFNPERFMPGGDKKKIDVKGHDFELIPFGAGRRICPGLSLGFVMVQMALASLIHSFDWAPAAADDHLDMSEAFGSTLPRAKPLIAVAKPILPSALYSSSL